MPNAILTWISFYLLKAVEGVEIPALSRIYIARSNSLVSSTAKLVLVFQHLIGYFDMKQVDVFSIRFLLMEIRGLGGPRKKVGGSSKNKGGHSKRVGGHSKSPLRTDAAPYRVQSTFLAGAQPPCPDRVLPNPNPGTNGVRAEPGRAKCRPTLYIA